MILLRRVATCGSMGPQFHSQSGWKANLMAAGRRTASYIPNKITSVAGLTKIVWKRRLSYAKCLYLVNTHLESFFSILTCTFHLFFVMKSSWSLPSSWPFFSIIIVIIIIIIIIIIITSEFHCLDLSYKRLFVNFFRIVEISKYDLFCRVHHL